MENPGDRFVLESTSGSWLSYNRLESITTREVAYLWLKNLVWLLSIGKASLFASASFCSSTGSSVVDPCVKAVVSVLRLTICLPFPISLLSGLRRQMLVNLETGDGEGYPLHTGEDSRTWGGLSCRKMLQCCLLSFRIRSSQSLRPLDHTPGTVDAARAHGDGGNEDDEQHCDCSLCLHRCWWQLKHSRRTRLGRFK
ncbi:hypothetical protein GW17_00018161 [Ensete ventricosum]|nr:hypothetical protein GW17_00018161 [Ensete ventricosum]